MKIHLIIFISLLIHSPIVFSLKLQSDTLSISETSEFNLDSLFNSNKDLVDLTLWSKSEKEIPESIGNLSKLKTLTIFYEALTKLPKSLIYLDSLKELIIAADNYVLEKDINILKDVKNLESLAINFQFNCDLSKIKNLKTLNLNSLNHLIPPKSFLKLNKLESININNCGELNFKNLCNVLPVNVSEIIIFNTQLNYIPCEITKFKKLSRLTLMNCNLSEIPNCLKDLPKRMLGILLNKNHIKDIPDIFENKNWGILLFDNPISNERFKEMKIKYPNVNFQM